MKTLHFIHSTISKHLDCLSLGAVIHNAAMNILFFTTLPWAMAVKARNPNH